MSFEEIFAEGIKPGDIISLDFRCIKETRRENVTFNLVLSAYQLRDEDIMCIIVLTSEGHMQTRRWWNDSVRFRLRRTSTQ